MQRKLSIRVAAALLVCACNFPTLASPSLPSIGSAFERFVRQVKRILIPYSAEDTITFPKP